MILSQVIHREDQDSLAYYVEKGYNDEHEYYERYKYDGAISSDISLTFEGEGTLNVISSNKEGIESKMHITINSGTYKISAKDDGINASSDNKSVITINGGTIIVDIDPNAEEGDGIDSNGSIYINGGTIYAFACPGSDNGLDSDNGIYINGGTILSTGSMYEEFKSSNNQKIIQMQLATEINEGESVIIVDEEGKSVFAFKTDRKISTFAYSSKELEDKTYTAYSGTSITGEVDENNIYTKIDSFNIDELTKLENSEKNMMRGPQNEFGNNMQEKNDSRKQYTMIVIGTCLGVLLIAIIIMVSGSKKKGKK